MANMTVTTAAKHIGEVWPRAVLRAQEFNLEIAPRVYRDWKFAGYGDVYHVPRIPNIETQTKSASTDWTPSAYTDTEQTVTIDTHQVSGFLIEDITKTLSNTNMEMEMRQKIGYSLGRALEVNLATLPQSFSQVIGTLGEELDYNDYVEAWEYLARAGIKLNPSDCTWVVSVGAASAMLKQEIFISQLYQGDNPRAVEAAKIGKLLNAPVIVSNLTRAPAAGQSESFLMYKKSMALIQAKNADMVVEYQALKLGTVVGGQSIYGYAEVDRYSETPGNVTATDEWAVLLRTVA